VGVAEKSALGPDGTVRDIELGADSDERSGAGIDGRSGVLIGGRECELDPGG
jgi:hypothetical protein